MNAVTMAATLLACALAGWGLRVLLIAVLPPERLPGRVREELQFVAPAVLAALVVAALVHGAADPLAGIRLLVTPTPVHVALLVAGVAAWRFRTLVAPMAAALLVLLAARLLIG